VRVLIGQRHHTVSKMGGPSHTKIGTLRRRIPARARCDYFLIPCGSCLPFVLPPGALAGRCPARSRLTESSAGPSFPARRRPTGCLSPSCNIATILSRDDHPAVFHRAATSPPSFPETTSQLSSTKLYHRHHLFLFPRRPASCLPPSCDIATILSRRPHSQSWLLFAPRVWPTVTDLLLQHSSTT
jgi:hypothetical protein